MQPLVSVLMPAYNVGRFLAATLRSVLAQTWTHKEIIIVDDGSRDDTLAVARSFESPCVKVISQENRGQSASENVAIRACQGDLFEFFDSDDLMQPDKLETQVRRLQAEGLDCVASGKWARFRDQPGDIPFVPQPFWTDMDPVDWLVSAWERHSMMHGAAWLIPRGIAEKAGYWDESLSLINDFDYFPRVLLACRRVLFCPDAVTWYRSGIETSLSGSKSRKAWDSAHRALLAGTARLLAREDSPRTRRACIRQFQEFVYAAYPDVPDLVQAAERRVRELGGGMFPPQGGPKFQMFASIVGWRMAKRIQRLQTRWSARRRAV